MQGLYSAQRNFSPAPTAGEAGRVPTYPDLRGKVAVVTGGSKGIGAATCRVLAANGVKVAVVAREQVGIDSLVRALRAAGAEAIGISADMVSLAEVERTLSEVELRLGPVDILAPFAGGFGRATPIVDITETEWQAVIAANLTSTFLACRTFLPGMIQRRQGVIVTMASNAGRLLDVTLTASYAAAKAGVVMFTRHVAMEVGPSCVRVNCIAPATTLSERVQGLFTADEVRVLAEMAPLRRIGTPEDAALAALFLASDASAWLTGVTLDVSGGRIML